MPQSDFTQAEQQLLRLGALGYSNSQIAEELKISVSEVSQKFDLIATKIVRIDDSFSFMKESIITRDSTKNFLTEHCQRFIIILVLKSTLTLGIQHNKLEQAVFRLKEQDRVLFETCMGALKQNNEEEATKLATELAEVRKRVKLFYNVQLAIVRVILRIEEHNCTDTSLHIEHSVKLLRDISREIADIQPDISKQLKTACQVLMMVCNQEC
jgi:division protein CdvB (Snf7/Vps24/ESCRT-III family)